MQVLFILYLRCVVTFHVGQTLLFWLDDVTGLAIYFNCRRKGDLAGTNIIQPIWSVVAKNQFCILLYKIKIHEIYQMSNFSALIEMVF